MSLVPPPRFGTAAHSSSRFGRTAFGQPSFQPIGLRPESSLYLGRAILGTSGSSLEATRTSEKSQGKRRAEEDEDEEAGRQSAEVNERRQRKKGKWVPPPLRPGYEYVRDENGLWTVQTIKGMEVEPVKWLKDFGGDTDADVRRNRREGREYSEYEEDEDQDMDDGVDEDMER